MYTLVAFATQWGSKHGGINTFNTDFLSAFGVAYYHSVNIYCIVASSTEEENTEALKSYVQLVTLPYEPSRKEFDVSQAAVGIAELVKKGVTFQADKTIWLGHDRITGEAAISAANSAGGRSAIIHHMSYDHYEAFAENSHTAYTKVQSQISLLQRTDLILAVGPLLRDAAEDRVAGTKPIHMLIPGLADIKVREAPKTFTAFLSGRLSDDATRIKQIHLGIAAFAQAHSEARDNGMPESLSRQPKLVLRGVDAEFKRNSLPEADLETVLKKFAEEYAHSVINLHALPFTQDRELLYRDLNAASVALMPSWHEGFGLVAWEAIASCVPLIVSRSSGVYQLLEEFHPGTGPGCVYPINVRGMVDSPYFHPEDLNAVVAALKAIAQNPSEARRKASSLRNILGEYTWPACVKVAVDAFQWPLNQGSITSIKVAEEPTVPRPLPMTPVSSTQAFPLQIPAKDL